MARVGAGGSLRRIARGAVRSALPVASLRGIFRRLVSPALPAQQPGRLREEAVAALVATAEAFAGVPIERDHYEALFRWRAEHLPGHRALYERFAATVDRAATRYRARNFADCGHGARLEIIRPVFQVRVTKSRWGRLGLGVLRREWILFDRHIVRPIAVLFALTDAWRAAGYEAWRGIPRGLERYTRSRTELAQEDSRA